MKKYVLISVGVVVVAGLLGWALSRPSSPLGGYSFSGATVSNVTVTSSDSVVLTANSARKYAQLQAVPGVAIPVYCSFTSASADGSGFVLSPTSGIPLILDVEGNQNAWTGGVLCEHGGAAQTSVTPTLAVVEY